MINDISDKECGQFVPLTVGQAAQLDHCGLYRYSPKAEQERLAVENFAVNEPESTADRDEAIASSSDLSIRIAVQVYSSLLGAYLAEGNRRGLFA